MSLFDALPRGPSAGAVVPFAQEDLTRVFEAKTVQRGRTLIMTGAVLLGDPGTGQIKAEVNDLGRRLAVTITPVQGKRGAGRDRRTGRRRRGREVIAQDDGSGIIAVGNRCPVHW